MSVVVPFAGGPEDAAGLLDSLGAMELRPDDEVIVADNTENGIVAEAARGCDVTVVQSRWERSSYHTRNVGAERASNEWLLFVDSDTRPRPDLPDRYFSEPIGRSVGAVVGPMLPLRRDDGVISRYAESRTQNEQLSHFNNRFKPFGATANLLVRRAAFEEVGGFLEGIRSGGDADFCWRLHDAGWEIAYRPEAHVRHILRETLRAYLRLTVRYASGRRWQMRRWPDSDMRPKLARIMRCVVGVPYWWLRGRFERGLFKAIDALVILAAEVGYLFGNSPPPRWGDREDGDGRPGIAVMADRFPLPSETFIVNEVRAIQRAGRRVWVEARSRPRRPAFGAAWGIEVSYGEDVGLARQTADLIWLVGRHPLGCLADLAARRRWRREEEVSTLRVLAPTVRRISRRGGTHLHAHFARRAALDALRIGRLLSIPYSVTAHAWDIFKQPTNLVEKLMRASFATTGCEYNLSYLRELVGEPHGSRIHEVVMGIDPRTFHRSRPYDGDATVVAVGRLSEKKGFEHLVEAASILGSDALRRLVIIGDGGQRDRLAARVRELGLTDVVELVGSRRPEEVRSWLERTALLAMPSIVARDGDRDSMPVVVKEALAMGVPVVASREVGLPEVVRDEWGRLVPPGDAEALASAIRELLAEPVEVRRAMGERGRDFVVREFSVDAETRKLLELIDSSAS
ncbi:MAG: glycosyltransferase [Solirubrobacterales bacterium]